MKKFFTIALLMLSMTASASAEPVIFGMDWGGMDAGHHAHSDVYIFEYEPITPSTNTEDDPKEDTDPALKINWLGGFQPDPVDTRSLASGYGTTAADVTCDADTHMDWSETNYVRLTADADYMVDIEADAQPYGYTQVHGFTSAIAYMEVDFEVDDVLATATQRNMFHMTVKAEYTENPTTPGADEWDISSEILAKFNTSYVKATYHPTHAFPGPDGGWKVESNYRDVDGDWHSPTDWVQGTYLNRIQLGYEWVDKGDNIKLIAAINEPDKMPEPHDTTGWLGNGMSVFVRDPTNTPIPYKSRDETLDLHAGLYLYNQINQAEPE